MVCDRCKMVVSNEIRHFGWTAVSIDLGEVELAHDISAKQRLEFSEALKNLGFELLEDEKSRTVEKVKNLIVKLVHEHSNAIKIRLSDYLSAHIHKDYSAISNLFSQETGTTI